MRMTIAAFFAATFTISVSAQEFLAGSGTPAISFPKPDRPVADIVSPIWHDEKERDNAGEPTQLVRLLGIKSGMTVADIGAGSGYYVIRLSPIVGPRGRIIAEDVVPEYLQGLRSRVRDLIDCGSSDEGVCDADGSFATPAHWRAGKSIRLVRTALGCRPGSPAWRRRRSVV